MKYTKRQLNPTIYLKERHRQALDKLASFQEVSISRIIRNLIDKAVGYSKSK